MEEEKEGDVKIPEELKAEIRKVMDFLWQEWINSSNKKFENWSRRAWEEGRPKEEGLKNPPTHVS